MKQGKILATAISLNIVMGGVIVFMLGRNLSQAPAVSHAASQPGGSDAARGPDIPPMDAAGWKNEQDAPAEPVSSPDQPAENPVALASKDVTQQSTQAPGAQPANVPLFFLDPDPSMKMDEAQVNAWATLQDRFIAAMGDPNPNDPKYRERWEKAQNELDDDFHAQFGNDIYNALLNKRIMMMYNQPAPR